MSQAKNRLVHFLRLFLVAVLAILGTAVAVLVYIAADFTTSGAVSRGRSDLNRGGGLTSDAIVHLDVMVVSILAGFYSVWLAAWLLGQDWLRKGTHLLAQKVRGLFLGLTSLGMICSGFQYLSLGRVLLGLLHISLGLILLVIVVRVSRKVEAAERETG